MRGWALGIPTAAEGGHTSVWGGGTVQCVKCESWGHSAGLQADSFTPAKDWTDNHPLPLEKEVIGQGLSHLIRLLGT